VAGDVVQGHVQAELQVPGCAGGLGQQQPALQGRHDRCREVGGVGVGVEFAGVLHGPQTCFQAHFPPAEAVREQEPRVFGGVGQGTGQ